VILLTAMTKRKPPVVDEDMTAASLVQYFAKVPAPRIARSQLHPLESVFVLSLCAVICGANSLVGIDRFAKAGAPARLSCFRSTVVS
jgi:hypothetical protein